MSEVYEGSYVWLLYDFPAPKGPTAVVGMYRKGTFWSKEVEGWFAPESISDFGRPGYGMWIDGWIKGWRRYTDGPGEVPTGRLPRDRE